jgi:hypothetical protein
MSIFNPMHIDTYPLAMGTTAMVYEFISTGERGEILKLVIYSKTHLYNFYNLGFGDKNTLTGDIDDTVISNNGDSAKVLATVAATLYTFTEKFPQAMVFVSGSTAARTRLYRIGISNNLEVIKVDFEIFGLTANNRWVQFEKNQEFDAFLVNRKKN